MTDGTGSVGGRYQLGEVLGRGGMAEVRRATDLRLGRDVAVKRLLSGLPADPTTHARFRREAQAAASLNHPAVASVFDTGEDRDPETGASVPYIVMELVSGRTLRDVLAEEAPLPPARALQIVARVLEALAHSHDAGIVHRDIKPANVMLTPAGEVKVMDFGIARAVDQTSTSLTQTSMVIGTAQYLSPEQARGETVDLRSDLYSTGCLLYELVCGRPPFTGETSLSVAYQHVREQPVPPSARNPALTVELDRIVLRALAKDPADRYPSARAMRSEVLATLDRLGPGTGATAAVALPAGHPVNVPASQPQPAATTATDLPAVPVEPPGSLEPSGPSAAAPPRRRRRAGTVLVLVVVLLLVGLGGVGAYRALTGPAAAAAAAVSVPGVLGRSAAEADTMLRNADLVPHFTNVAGDTDTVDTVVGQEPRTGANVPARTVITVAIDVGPASAHIPRDLVGQDLDQAESALADAGFTHVSTRPGAPTEDVGVGQVLSVRPGEGAQAALEQDVVLVVARRSAGPGTPSSSRTRSSRSPTDSPSASPSRSASSSPTRSSPTATRTTSEPTETPAPTETSAPAEPSEPTDTESGDDSEGGKSSGPESKDPKPEGSAKSNGKAKNSAKPKSNGQGNAAGNGGGSGGATATSPAQDEGTTG